MDHRSFLYQLTPEDRRVIGRWKVRIGIAYGTILIALVLIMTVSPSERRTQTAKAPTIQGYAPASLIPALLPAEQR
jgi:hypothetical protein